MFPRRHHSPEHRPNAHRNETLWGWIIAAPGGTGLFLFMAVPFLAAVILSFTNYRLNSPMPAEWIGLQHYRELLTDTGFRRALLNNCLFAACIVPLQTGLALVLALLVNRPLPGIVFFRTIFFLPVIYPMALVSVVWGLIFAPGDSGLMNAVLQGLSLGMWNGTIDFLHNPWWALPSIMVMSLWQGAGFQMVIILAGLQAIPKELYEAATIDGAGRWSQFRHVTLPQLRNTLLFVAMVTTILAFRLFDQVWILTQGGPNNTTTTVMYEAFLASRERDQIGLGSAMTVIFFVLVAAIALTQHFLVRQKRQIT